MFTRLRSLFFHGCLYICIGLMSACVSYSPWQSAILYERLGGEVGVNALVADSYYRINKDLRINTQFASLNEQKFKDVFRRFICFIADGGCAYVESELVSLLQPFKINDFEFNSLINDFNLSLKKLAVTAKDRQILLDRLQQYRAEIVFSKPIEQTVSAIAEGSDISIQKVKPDENKTITLAKQELAGTGDKKILETNAGQEEGTNTATKKATEKKQKAREKQADVIQAAKQQKALFKLTGSVKITGLPSGLPANYSSAVVLEPLTSAQAVGRQKPETHVAIMKKKIYRPAYLTVRQGDSVAFHNLDKFKHNVFSSTGNARFDLGAFAYGKRPDAKMNTLGVVKIYCDIHPKMAMFVYVTKSPFHIATTEQGDFTFNQVPPGDYKLTVWNIRGNLQRKVTVKPGGNQHISLQIDGSRYVAVPHLNKKGEKYSEKSLSLDQEDEEYF